ncbi:MAG: GNAT family N-acetyltransferase [Gammaproteobacteria bacterium]|nr:GNAT family N-acetyltransferase [Gammaproteobacteria bacterium]
MGSINLTLEPDHEQAELGSGLASPTGAEVMPRSRPVRCWPYAFGELAVNRVHAHHMLRNPASGAVLRKIGMQSEGVLRQRIKKSGTCEDVAIYAMLRREFAGSQGVGVEEKVR